MHFVFRPKPHASKRVRNVALLGKMFRNDFEEEGLKHMAVGQKEATLKTLL